MNEELKNLINTSETLTDEERGYWFQIIPSMTQMQVDRLFEILSNERRKLDELYSQEGEDNEVEAIIQVHEDICNEKDLEIFK